MSNFNILLIAGAIVAAAVPAAAEPNLIVNGSFEDGFNGFDYVGAAGLTNPAIVIDYNSSAGYAGNGAFGEPVTPDTATTVNPDPVGGHAAYFVDDFSNNEALTQLTLLQPGNYEIGFSGYLTANGFANVNDARFSASIIGVELANLLLSSGTAGVWANYNGVAQVVTAGFYRTAFTFSAFGDPAKDAVVDRVYVVPTTRQATVILGDPTAPVPEPATWALLMAGFGMVGFAARRRRTQFVAS